MAFPNMLRLGRIPRLNDSMSSITQLPTSVLDAFVPGYSFVSQYLLDAFSFDISIIVSLCVLLVAFATAGKYIGKALSSLFFAYLSASITIYDHDPIHEHIIEWVAEQAALRTVRNLKGYSAGENFDNDVDDMKMEQDLSDDSIFNFNNWAESMPPRYQPHTGFHRFQHKSRWFWFSVDKDRVPGGWMGMTVQDQERVTLTTIGRSTQPVKDLIVEIRDKHFSHQVSKTTIRRPTPKEQRGRGRQAWVKVAMRPSRPMVTVVLDDKQKAKILKDINDFLHPRMPRWYANRGIPYRRGYLFHGAPGTGKTSLSFALAGVFGLDIYCLSLSEATLTEEDLILLFNNLPRRCVVLLEDIDSAGVLRKKKDSEDEEKSKPARKRKSDDKDAETDDKKANEDPTAAAASAIAKAVASAVKGANDSAESGRRGPSLNNQGISMSGLLNAIDGVASQEGRVLVMTTNHPEKLDDALIRPGRVDLQIEFKLASRQQSRELFLRMYCEDTEILARQPLKLSEILPRNSSLADEGVKEKAEAEAEDAQNCHLLEPEKTAPVLANGHAHKPVLATEPTPPMTPTPSATTLETSLTTAHAASRPTCSPNPDPAPAASLSDLATAFAAALPPYTFSPAEIQGYLLTQKKSPRHALLKVGKWRDEMLTKKSKNEEGEREKEGQKEEDEGGKEGMQ